MREDQLVAFEPGLIAAPPTHPVRKIHTAPDIFECATPVRGSYPAWRDPVYWIQGARVDWPLPRVLKHLKANARRYARLFFEHHGGLTAAFAAALLAGGAAGALSGAAPVLLIGMSQLFFYGYASVLQPRFAGGLLLWLFLPAFTACAMARDPVRRGIGSALALAGALSLLLPATPSLSTGVRDLARELSGRGQTPHEHLAVARHLRSAGLPEGSRLASVGYSYRHFFARLGHFSIVAEIPDRDRPLYWSLPPGGSQKLDEILGQYGVRALIADRLPNPPPPDWNQVPGTGYAFRLLRPSAIADQAFDPSHFECDGGSVSGSHSLNCRNPFRQSCRISPAGPSLTSTPHRIGSA